MANDGKSGFPRVLDRGLFKELANACLLLIFKGCRAVAWVILGQRCATSERNGSQQQQDIPEKNRNHADTSISYLIVRL
jgi:hypothetical protein